MTTTATRTRTRERNTYLQDILIAAVEGGTGYWAAAGNYHWDDDEPETAHATLHELNEDTYEFDGATHEVTVDTIAKGLGKIRRGEVPVNDRLATAIREADRENDAGEIDADAADVIVQAALFGEIVYG